MAPKAKLFRFAGYKIQSKEGKIVFKYKTEFHDSTSRTFEETIVLPKVVKNLTHKNAHKFLQPLDLILGINYYKLYCPPKIELPYKLSKEQAEFWNTVYKKGLGEFAYKNKLDPKDFVKFTYVNHKEEPVRVEASESILLGIGGGKDSIVALELLKHYKLTLFNIKGEKPNPISNSVIRESGQPSFSLTRVIDTQIFNKDEDFYRGHIPVSAIYAFLATFCAYLYGHKYVVVGNEYSSNFGNLKYKGEVINHQWSKSGEFEAMFQEYTKKFITPDIIYFSVLRQFYEIRIAKMFAKYPKYFDTFSSCNRSFRISEQRPEHLWCGECPKCAFVFLILAPFIPKSRLVKIFGKNMLADPVLVPLYRDILGFGKLKPFDCVGTFDESRVALYMASAEYKNDIIVKTFVGKVGKPEQALREVFQTFPAPTLPAPFKLLGIDSVAILGYGLEGKVTEKYIKKNYPKLKIKILDQAKDKNYLEKQKDYDLVIKTPGISKSKVTTPYTTATNLFFSQNQNSTIGITGSKGKSTTASMVYAMLKTAGKNVELLGNIGRPMLGALLQPQKKDKIFVIELSSYMLEDIEHSPNIAVLLNLFPEHMNYHGGLEEYYEAKKNIFKFQKLGDIALRPPFNEKLPVQNSEIHLLGKHNLENIKAATRVARILKIPEKYIRNAVMNFKNLPHRLEYVGEYKGIKFYDDAISTTPESTIEALKALPKTATIFLGGEDRGYNFNGLEKVLRKSGVKNIVLFPDTGKRILKSTKGFKIFKTKSMADAVKFAYANTPQGAVCLLSTASPSYSVWKNFEEKGDLFKSLVKKYGKN